MRSAFIIVAATAAAVVIVTMLALAVSTWRDGRGEKAAKQLSGWR